LCILIRIVRHGEFLNFNLVEFIHLVLGRVRILFGNQILLHSISATRDGIQR
jgi:hypothetical protein